MSSFARQMAKYSRKTRENIQKPRGQSRVGAAHEGLPRGFWIFSRVLSEYFAIRLAKLDILPQYSWGPRIYSFTSLFGFMQIHSSPRTIIGRFSLCEQSHKTLNCPNLTVNLNEHFEECISPDAISAAFNTRRCVCIILVAFSNV